MRRTAVPLLIVVAMCAGCASLGRYAKDRGNDFVDCFKLAGGWGIGLDADVHVTDLFSTGAGFAAGRKWGFAGRHPVGFARQGAAACRSGNDVHVGLPIAPFYYWWSTEPNGLEDLDPDGRLRPYCTDHCIRDAVWFEDSPLSRETASILILNMRALRKASDGDRRRLIDVFDVDVGATLLPLSVRAGLSPGQLVDFVLGWTTLDLGGDDR